MAIKISNSTIVDDSRNIVDAGISTFVGVGTFQNDLYVGGTLHAPSLTGGATFIGDDVTTRNLLASGISTFQGNVNVSAGKVGIRTDSLQGKISFPTSTGVIDEAIISAGNDLVDYGLYVVDSGTQNYVRQFTGNNYSISVGATKTFRISNADGINSSPSNTGGMRDDQVAFVVNPDTSTELRYDYKKKLETASSGINVVGTTTTGQLSVTGVSTFQGDAYFGDHFFIKPEDPFVGGINAIRTSGTLGNPEREIAILSDAFYVQNTSGSKFFINCATDAGLALYYNGQVKFQTTSGGVDITGHTELDNVRLSGVLTATSAEFSGNVTVLGDLTYENVTNVDAIGIATARSGLRITGGGLNVTGVSTHSSDVELTSTGSLSPFLRFKNTNGERLYMYADGQDALIQAQGTGDLKLIQRDSGDVKIQVSTTENAIWARYQGSVDLYHNNVKKFETTGAGVTVTGTAFSNQLNVSGVSTFVGVGTFQSDLYVDGDINFTGDLYQNGSLFSGGGGGESYWVSTAAGIHTLSNVGVGTTNPTTKLQVGGVLGFGPDNNVRIGDNTTGSSLTPQVGGSQNGTGNNFIGAGAGNSVTTGNDNNFFGREAGYYNTTGSNNNFFGVFTGGYNTGSHNNFFGQEAGAYNTGNYNNFFSVYAGYYNTTGSNNNFFGRDAGSYNTTGNYNNFFGRDAGYYNTTGSNNIFFGSYTGVSATASNKIIFGHGFDTDNLFDSPDTDKDIQFAVGVRTDANPSKYWLVGDENFNIGIGTTNPSYKLDVNGDINFTGDLYQNGSLFSGGGGGGGDSYWASTSAGIHTLSSVGIGTTNPKVRLQLDGVLGFGTIQGNAFPSTNILIGDENTGPNLTPKVGGDWKGLNNNFIGAGAGKSTTTGTGNNFFGLNAGENNTTGYYNNFFGLYAGCSNTTGNNNNFFGGYATGIANTSGYYNNFFGNSAGRYNTSGHNNNFLGSSAGRNNTTGDRNNFLGNNAGFYNTTGRHNNFLGNNAGFYNTTGRYNNFFGTLAGYANTTGWHNNFFGYWAGSGNTTGQFNTFIGYRAGEYNTIGSSNHFIGQKAGFYNTVGEYNIFFGAYAGFYSTGSCNIVIGKSAVVPIPSGNNQLAIGIGNSNWINGNENYNIGIGTTNPTTKLHVVGVVSATTYYGDGTNLDNVKVPISATTTSLVAHNATFATIGLSTTITPINTSKKVYVDVSVPVYMNKGASVDFQQMEIDLRRNGTSLMIHQTGLYVGTVVGRQDYGTTVSFHYVDSPSTVGITTYEVFARSQNTTTNYWTSAKLDFSNTGSIIVAPSRITLMEVD